VYIGHNLGILNANEVAKEAAQWPGKRHRNSGADFISDTCVVKLIKILEKVSIFLRHVSAIGVAANETVETAKADTSVKQEVCSVVLSLWWVIVSCACDWNILVGVLIVSWRN
jgi:hypothetical protein